MSRSPQSVPVPVVHGALECWVSATPGPPIVLLHGFSFDHSMWEPQVAALQLAHQVITYDLRGFGRSSPPVAGRSHLDDLIDLLDRFGIERADLVGLSLGANVALAAAAYHPDRVGRLALLSSGLPGFTWQGRPPDEAAEVARREGVEAARRFWVSHELFASTRACPNAAQALEAMIDAFPAYQWRPGPVTDPLPAVDQILEAVVTPTLVLTGAHDLEGYRNIGRILGRRLRVVRHVELEQAGHVLSLEDPAGVNAQLLAFLTPRSAGQDALAPSGCV